MQIATLSVLTLCKGDGINSVSTNTLPSTSLKKKIAGNSESKPFMAWGLQNSSEESSRAC